MQNIQTIYKNDEFEWIDVINPSQKELKFIEQKYQINPLLLEDTIEKDHLPKYEYVDGVHFFLCRERTNPERNVLSSISDISTKISVFIIDNYLITIHRKKSISIDETLEIVKKNNPTSNHEVMLMIGLAIFRGYDEEHKRLTQYLDDLENEIFLKNISKITDIQKLYRIKRKSFLHIKLINESNKWVSSISNLDLETVQTSDLQDKLKDVLSDYEQLNTQSTNVISMCMSLSDMKSNQVMKTLTLFSVYFLPITFIAGVYGMNFKFMPELETKYGYFFTLALMILVVIIIYFYMKQKKFNK